jgi:hypothetical protein
MARHAVGTRVSSVSRTEGIHDEDIAQRRQPFRERFIIRRLADLETNVLTEHDIAGLHVETVHPIGYERDRTAEQGGKFGGYRRER